MLQQELVTGLISSQHHSGELLGRPSIHSDGSDKGNVGSKAPVDAAAVDANQSRKGRGCPLWITGEAVRTNVVARQCLDGILIRGVHALL